LVPRFPDKWKPWLQHLPVADEKHLLPTPNMF
jgi:hypothetical protein